MNLTAIVNRYFLEISNLGLNDLCKSTSLNFSSFRSLTTNLCGDPGAAGWLLSGICCEYKWNQFQLKIKKKFKLPDYKMFRLSVWVQGPSKGFGV